MRWMTRRQVMGSGLGGFMAIPWLSCLNAWSEPVGPTDVRRKQDVNGDARTEQTGLTDAEIVLGISAAFSGPSRGLGIELYRGANAYFEHVNRAGGIRGRKIVLKTYDDGYQPNPAVKNTMTLVLQDQVFALFGYVGTPTVTRVLPIHGRPTAEGTALREFCLQSPRLLSAGNRWFGRQFRVDRQQTHRRVLPG